MANAIYPKWKEEIIQGTAAAHLDGTGATGVNVALIDTGVYTYSSAHEDYADLGGIIDDEELENKTFAAGVLDGDNMTYTAVAGATVEAIVLYIENAGANTTWLLFCYIDTSVTGLPVTPNGGDITITWNGSGIVAL